MGRIQTGRLENLIRRWASIKGSGSVLSETLGDVFPVLDLENLTPENQLPAGWHLFSGFATVIGIAAQLTGLQLGQLAGRDSLVVVDKIIINSELAQDITYGLNLALFGAVTSSHNKDSRDSQAVNATAQLRANANVVGSGNAGIIAVAAGVDREFEVPHSLAVLGPDAALSVVSSTVDSDLTVTFIGRQRQAEPSELNF